MSLNKIPEDEVTAAITGGTLLGSGFFSSSTKGGSSSSALTNAIKMGATIAGTVDEIVLCVRPIDSSALVVHGSITWVESQ